VQIAITTEVRWFLRAQQDAVDVLERWFEKIAPEPGRVDRYVATDRDDFGVKVRDTKAKAARFETKDRLSAPVATRFAPSIAGRVECWRKVSLAVARAEATLDGEMIHVRKQRRARHFGIMGGHVVEVPQDPPVNPCCIVDWSTIEIESPRAPSMLWTLGFEASGTAEAQRTCLRAVAHELFATNSDLALTLDASCGYPELLAGLPRD
jgi:hypothetical protein